MTTVVNSEVGMSSRSLAVPRTGALWIPRQGIRWSGGIAGRPLRIEFLVVNRGTEPSAPKPVRIDVAPFGAFVPWRPLVRLTLPGIPPGGRVVMTATAGDDELPRSIGVDQGGSAPLSSAASPDSTLFSYASALQALRRKRMGLEPVHFVGNLNVYLEECEPVERHFHRAVGLQAGMENWSLFIIGDGRDDSYTLRPEAEPGWRVDLEPGSWDTPIRGPVLCAFVKFVPPAGAERGRVAIWVRRESTGQDVPVEFELSTQAPEAHCYRR